MILCALLAGPGFAAERQYDEAHIFVTAPPATEKGAALLLADRNFDAFDTWRCPTSTTPPS